MRYPGHCACILLLALAWPAWADTVTFNLRQLTGSPSAKRMTLTPWGVTADGANVQTGEPVTFAPTDGEIITTLLGGTYLMQFQGLRRGQYIAVPGDGGTYNASDLFVVSMAAPEGSTAWSRSGADARFVHNVDGSATNLTLYDSNGDPITLASGNVSAAAPLTLDLPVVGQGGSALATTDPASFRSLIGLGSSDSPSFAGFTATHDRGNYTDLLWFDTTGFKIESFNNVIPDSTAIQFSYQHVGFIGDVDMSGLRDLLVDRDCSIGGIVFLANGASDDSIYFGSDGGDTLVFNTRKGLPCEIAMVCAPEDALPDSGPVFTFYAPYAMTVTEVFASVNSAPNGNIYFIVGIGGQVAVYSGFTLLSGNTTYDYTGTFDHSTVAKGDRIDVEVTYVAATAGGEGLKVWLLGTRN